MQFDFLMILCFFFVYCFIGWVWESSYESILNKKLLNRGFFNGPYIPLYGFGGLFILLVCQRFQAPLFSIDTIIIYFVGSIGATILEYITSLALEKILKARWWDYSNYPLNINGRICLIASLFWGVVAVAAIDLLNPWLIGLYEKVPHDARLVFASVMSTLFVMDMIVTVNSILDLYNRMSLFVALEKEKLLETLLDKKEDLAMYRGKLASIGNPFTKRIIESFPNLRFTSDKLQRIFERIKGISHRKKDK